MISSDDDMAVEYTWGTAMMLIGSGSPAPAVRAASPDDVLRFAEQHFGLATRSLSRAGKGSNALSDVKHMVRHYLHGVHPGGLSLNRIGKMVGMTDNTVTSRSIRKHADLMEVDGKYREAYKAFELAAWTRGFHIEREVFK